MMNMSRKPLWLFLSLLVFLTSCKEKYQNIDPARFNKKLSADPHIKNATQLVLAYNARMTFFAMVGDVGLDTALIDDGKVRITAIINTKEDEVKAAEKYVFIAQHQGLFWKVSEIRYNWRCKDGQGHTGWGI